MEDDTLLTKIQCTKPRPEAKTVPHMLKVVIPVLEVITASELQRIKNAIGLTSNASDSACAYSYREVFRVPGILPQSFSRQLQILVQIPRSLAGTFCHAHFQTQVISTLCTSGMEDACEDSGTTAPREVAGAGATTCSTCCGKTVSGTLGSV